MNDRYKATAGARAAADSNKSDFDLDQALGGDDPLVELARIVSGRPPIESGPARRTPSKATAQMSADLASDLEAELMGGLKPMGLSPAPKKIPDPANDWPAPAVPNPPESKAEAAKPGNVDFSALSLRRGDGEAPRVLPLRPREVKPAEAKSREARSEEAPTPRAEPGRDHDRRSSRLDLPVRQAKSTAAERSKTSDAAPAKSARPQPAPFAWAVKKTEEGATGAPPATPALDAAESAPRSNSNASAFDGIDESLDAFFNQAPPPGTDTRVAGIPDDFFTPYDGTRNPAAGPQATNSLTDDIAATLASYEPVPGYGLPGSDEGAEDGASHGGRRKLFVGVSVLVAALLIGGGVVVAYQFRGIGNVGSPPVVAADTRPTKIAGPPPSEGTKEATQQDKIFRDRIDQNSPVGKLLTAGNATPANLPDVTKNAPAGSREISRIIAPGAPGDQSVTPPVPATTANDTADGPRVRQVRTIIVKPDATVVSSGTLPTGDASTPAASNNPVPASGNSPLAAVNPPPSPAPAANVTAASRSTTTTREFNAGAAAQAATPAPAPTVVATTPLTGASSVTGNAPPAAAKTVGNTSTGQPVTTGTTVVATNPPPTQTTTTKAVPPAGGTGQQTANTTAPAARTTGAANAVAPGTDGFVVQVTSQKSESQALAAFKDLQKRYPSLLGDKQPDVQKADLGERGVFFRVRVGPAGTKEAATSFCEGLKSAGADCLITRN